MQTLFCVVFWLNFLHWLYTGYAALWQTTNAEMHLLFALVRKYPGAPLELSWYWYYLFLAHKLDLYTRLIKDLLYSGQLVMG